jgi:hypothetical protein
VLLEQVTSAEERFIPRLIKEQAQAVVAALQTNNDPVDLDSLMGIIQFPADMTPESWVRQLRDDEETS